MEKEKKKFGQRIKTFLKDKAPNIIDTVGDILPDRGALGILKNLIDKDDSLSPEDKEHALKLIEMDLKEMDGITDRWKFDMEFGNALSKSIRPLVLAWMIVLLTVVLVLSFFGLFIPDNYLSLFQLVLLTVIGAYFSFRTIEKYNGKD